MIRIAQLTDRLIHTTQNESISCADSCAERERCAAARDSIRANSIESDSIEIGSIEIGSIEIGIGRFSRYGSFDGSNFSGNFDGSFCNGTVLQTFMYRPDSLLKLGKDCLDSAKQLVNRLAQHAEWQRSIRQSLEPRTIHRSREPRQLAMFSI